MSKSSFPERLWGDIHYAVRVLSKNAGFTSLVVLSLGLGIGANTAIFSLIDAVLFKLLPVQNPQTLVQITKGNRSGSLNNFSYPAFEKLRDTNDAFTGMFAWNRTVFRLEQNGEADIVDGTFVSGEYYSTLGINASVGRTITAEDDKSLAESQGPVAVISDACWRKRFAQDPGVIGRSVILEGVPFTIIGVEPARFYGLEVGKAPEVTILLRAEPLLRPGRTMLMVRDAGWLKIFARLRPGAGEQQARAALQVLAPRIFQDVAPSALTSAERQQFLAQKLDFTPAGSGLSDLRKQFSKPLIILLAMVGLVLLIACANIANLLLARATARRREIAIRLAMGATRLELIRQLLTESIILALLGGALGLLLASWASSLLLNMMSSSLGQIVLNLHPDLRVMGFTVAVAALTGILFGLSPALNVTAVDPGITLKQNAKNISGVPGGRFTLGRLLVVSQVALAMLLLVIAGLFVRSLRNLQTLNTGYTRGNILLVGSDLHKAHYDGARLERLYTELLERLNSMPGVKLASVAMFAPLDGGGFTLPVKVDGHQPEGTEDVQVHVNSVGPRFFEVLGMRIVTGRGIEPRDSENAAPVAVINETMARYYFPGQNPVGKRLVLGHLDTRAAMEIVGVAPDSNYDNLRAGIPRTVYFAYRQEGARVGPMTFVIRTSGASTSLVTSIRREFKSIDESFSIRNVKTLEERIDQSLGQERLIAILSTCFGLLALILTAVGLYGIMVYTVARRTAEIGLRMALGAQRADVLWMIFRDTLSLVVIGVLIGVPASVALTRGVSSLLYGLTAEDPLTLLAATLLMLTIAAIAAYMPARKASRVDPVVSLRYE